MGLYRIPEYLDYEWTDSSLPLTEAEQAVSTVPGPPRRDLPLTPVTDKVASPPGGTTRTRNAPASSRTRNSTQRPSTSHSATTARSRKDFRPSSTSKRTS